MKPKITFTLLFFLVCSMLMQAQKTKLDYKKASKEGKVNYFEIVAQKNKEIKAYDLNVLSNQKEVKQFNRWAFFWKDRVSKAGVFPSANLAFYNTGILSTEGKIIKRKGLESRVSGETWVNVGPQNLPDVNGYPNPPQMGRLNTLLRIKHPSDSNLDVLFVAAPNGGVWKSMDGGTTWQPKLDQLAAIGVTDIKTTPDATYANYTTKPIYVSTGDYDGGNVKSIGVLKSTDGGETFNSTGLSYPESQGETLGELIVANENTVLVGTKNNIQITTDGGNTWSVSYTPDFTDSEFGRVAISGTKAMYSGYYDVAYTDDYTAGNWSLVITGNDFNKHAVTVGEDGVFYVQDINGQIKKFNSTTKTFADHGTPPPGYEPQQGFNQALIVKNNIIISGEVDAQSSTDNGNTWYKSLNGYWANADSDGNYIHSDHHGLGLLDGTNEFWSVNDGGLSYIDYGNTPTNQKPTITYKSEKVIVTQAYSVAINPAANDDAYVMANQDNDAFSKRNGTWYSVAMGDGIQSAINYNNSDIRYAGNQTGIISQSNTGFAGQLNGNGQDVSVPGANFYFPLEIHKTNPTILFAGGDEVYKILDNDGLTISNLNSGAGVADEKSAIRDIATHGNAILVVGTNGIKFSNDGGANWSSKTAPAGTVNSVDFDATNTDIMYATVNGYTNGSKVFKSTDGGASFTNISGDLPNIVMKEVLLKQAQSNEILFVATELGVYFSQNGGTNWSRLGNGLPNVDVRDMEIHYTNDKLVAATYGRGLWEINIANTTLATDDFITEDKKLSIYPNPVVSGQLTIKLSNDNYKYLIYNVIGGIVQKGALSENGTVDVSSLAKNVYIIRVFNDKESYASKFIKANN